VNQAANAGVPSVAALAALVAPAAGITPPPPPPPRPHPPYSTAAWAVNNIQRHHMPRGQRQRPRWTSRRQGMALRKLWTYSNSAPAASSHPKCPHVGLGCRAFRLQHLTKKGKGDGIPPVPATWLLAKDAEATKQAVLRHQRQRCWRHCCLRRLAAVAQGAPKFLSCVAAPRRLRYASSTARLAGLHFPTPMDHRAHRALESRRTWEGTKKMRLLKRVCSQTTGAEACSVQVPCVLVVQARSTGADAQQPLKAFASGPRPTTLAIVKSAW